MIILYIILSIIGIAAIVVFAWLFFLSKPKTMSLDEMIVRVRGLRVTYSSFGFLERESYVGQQVLKSILYLESEIKKVSKYA